MKRLTLILFLLGLTLLGAAVAAILQGRYLVFSSWPPFPKLVAGTLAAASCVVFVVFVRQLKAARALESSFVFTLDTLKLPTVKGKTYVGRGFAWTTDHTRKLWELSGTGEIERIKQRAGAPGDYIHGLGLQGESERDLFIDNRLLAQHTLVIGTTGSGKTRLKELLITQAIERGEAVVVVDPKGDPDRRMERRIIETALRTGRIDQLRILDLTQPSRSIRYNPLGHFVYPKQLVSRIVASMPKEGESASFRDFAYKVVNAVVNAMHALNMKITLAKVYDYSDNVALLARRFMRERYYNWIEETDRRDIVRELVPDYERLRDEGRIQGSPDLEELLKIVRHPQEHYQKMITNLFPLFAKLCTGPDRALLSNEDPDEEELSWDAVDRRGMIVYLYLASNADVDRASAVGRMALLDLQSYLGVKYAFSAERDPAPMNIFVDELHAVLTEEYVSIINQARGAGFRVTMGSQSFADLEHVLRSKPAGKRVVANANVLLQLHVEEYDDAEIFASRCGRRQIAIPHTSVGYEPALLKSGKHDVEDFRITLNQGETLREVDLVPAWAVQELPVGHYFGKWGGVVYKGRFPFLPEPTVTEKDLEIIRRGRFAKEVPTSEGIRVGA